MPTTVALHKFENLAHEKSKTKLLLDTKKNTELYITVTKTRTIIEFPFGNKFDIVSGMIIIHDKS